MIEIGKARGDNSLFSVLEAKIVQYHCNRLRGGVGGVWGGCLVAQSVERATPGEEVMGLIPASARSLLVG